ncbi:hypothetical protein NDU88_002219 [Pleurodeles waltl]|uniref:Uncharacterized protein n=1 Tax=Pleurodeles waltl TaxID=8319 RepID=A0AAV7SCA9_PLEWA|nr:hypothetical protein NDU88_002219 [Pleurodeles waltl]
MPYEWEAVDGPNAEDDAASLLPLNPSPRGETKSFSPRSCDDLLGAVGGEKDARKKERLLGYRERTESGQRAEPRRTRERKNAARTGTEARKEPLGGAWREKGKEMRSQTEGDYHRLHPATFPEKRG